MSGDGSKKKKKLPKTPGTSTRMRKTVQMKRPSFANVPALKKKTSSENLPSSGKSTSLHLTKPKKISTTIPTKSSKIASTPFSVGLPIWMKFASFTCLLLISFLSIFGIFFSHIARKEIEDQINITGKKLTSYIVHSVDPFWRVEDLNKGRGKEKVSQLESKLKHYLQENKNDIFNILILDREETIVATALPAEQFKLYELSILEESDKYTIQETKIEGVRTRVFTAPIFFQDEIVGKAQVYLRANRIDEVQDNFRKQILLACTSGITLGVICTFLFSIFLTRPIQMLIQDIRTVSSGNFEHETRPHSRDEIGELAVAFNDMTKQLKIAQEEREEKKLMEHELEMATEIQTKLLPERLPQIPKFDIFVYYLSAKHVGGDYYDFIVIDKKHLGIVVADVSGKGVPGSMVMTMARSLIRLASRGNPSPADTLRKVNKILSPDMKSGMFVSAIYMVLNIQSKELKVCSAGHNPLILYRGATREIELVKPKGIAIGFDRGAIFDANIVEESVQLYSGDRIVAYTDGVVEAMNEANEEFGDQKFYNLTKKYGHASSKEYVDAIVKELEQHRGNAEQSDDITISTVKIQ